MVERAAAARGCEPAISYTVAIVTPPVPDNNAEAWNALDSFIQEHGPTPDIFRMLHDRLTARHPCICDLPDDQVDDGAWSDGPLIDSFAHRAAVLGIASTRVGDVLPFLIDSATAIGLTVFSSPLVQRPDDPRWMAADLAKMMLL